MKIFFDSTYFFPGIGIKPKKVLDDYLLHWLDHKDDHELLYSDLSLFELQAKGAKYIQTNQLTKVEVSEGILAIKAEQELSVIPFWESKVTSVALSLRKEHKDFIDCVLLASAMVYADIFVSEDDRLISLMSHPAMTTLLQNWAGNRQFKITKSKNFVPSE